MLATTVAAASAKTISSIPTTCMDSVYSVQRDAERFRRLVALSVSALAERFRRLVALLSTTTTRLLVCTRCGVQGPRTVTFCSANE